MQIKLHDIEWDTDGEVIDPSLPTELWVEDHPFADGHILTEDDLIQLSEQVSDKFGQCITTLNYTCYEAR